jgi:hypothetical protein
VFGSALAIRLADIPVRQLRATVGPLEAAPRSGEAWTSPEYLIEISAIVIVAD